jgi:hypothetical protein
MVAKKRAKGKGEAKEIKGRIAAEALPRLPLSQVIRVAEVFHNYYAGGPVTWEDIAKALQYEPTSGYFRYVMSSAQAYGLISKQDSKAYTLTELGRKIATPFYEEERLEGVRRAILTPTLLSQFYSFYDGHPLPPEQHLPAILESRFGVPHNRVGTSLQVIIDNAYYAGIVDNLSGSDQPIINLSKKIFIEQDTSEPSDKAELIIASPTTSKNDGVDWVKICFYITPIGDEDTPVRKHADMMLKHLLEPVLKNEFGLNVIRADKIEESGLITRQVFEHLAKAGLCIADLSFGNPNAFYELGVRHVFRLPTIQIIRKGDRIPFDVSQGRTITIDTSDIYTVMDRFESARRELAEHIRKIQSSGSQDIGADNPVNIYLPGLKISIPK